MTETAAILGAVVLFALAIAAARVWFFVAFASPAEVADAKRWREERRKRRTLLIALRAQPSTKDD